MLLRTQLSPSPVSPPPLLHVPQWAGIPHLAHGFLGRCGGVSRPPMAGLNLSLRVGDDAQCVRENWARVTDSIPGMRFIGMAQVHGTRVATVATATTSPGEADALVTNVVGVGLSILTADCVPVLMVAPRQRVIGAVHAGWRGTLGGIVGIALQQLRAAFGVPPEDISAALGPAIGGCCYEVDPSIADALERSCGGLPDAIRRQGLVKPRVDLRLLNAALLRRAGVQERAVIHVGPCTRCTLNEYFSHRGERGVTGRQLSFIGWRA